MNEAAKRVSRYLLSQLSVNAVEGTLIGIGLAVIGIPNAALWGILVVLLRFIPYLGIVIAALFPLALAIAVDPGWSLLVWTALLFVATELVVANLVEPWLYAGTTGLSSIAVIIAAVFWTWLWGPIGLLLSTPLTACLLVLGRRVPQLRFLDVILGSEPVLTPAETFHQRLLADDPEEATEQAEQFAKEKSIEEFAEKVAIPVLARTQADSDSGILPPERRGTVKEGFAKILENLFDDSVIEEDPAAEGEARRPESGLALLRGLAAGISDFRAAGRAQAIEFAGLVFSNIAEIGCSEDLPIPRVGFVRQDSHHHVSAPDPTKEGRQNTRLLERRGESAARRWPGGAAAGSVFGRDPSVTSRGLAPGDRGVRRGVRRAANLGAVPGGSLRGGSR
jgi:hypothetical protein